MRSTLLFRSRSSSSSTRSNFARKEAMATRTSLMEFQIPKIVHEEVDEQRGIFVIEPLDRGFGYTFGNSLRRVLLSSLEGAAVTSVKIEGVAHEFTTLPGVREDVTDMILNLKTLVCVLHGDSPFSPVRRVSYDVEAARVGQRTDYDKLRLDVTTDGSVNPKDAIAEAAEILIRQLAIFTDIDKIDVLREGVSVGDEGGVPVESFAHGMENFPIEELELGVRSYNCLKRVGIETIGDLVTKSESELAAIPNFGKKSVEEVKETLAAHGLTLREE